jgi:hypothetical protein
MGTAGLPPAKKPLKRKWPEEKDYGDSTKPGVCDRLDAKPEGSASHKSLPTE